MFLHAIGVTVREVARPQLGPSARLMSEPEDAKAMYDHVSELPGAATAVRGQ